MQNPLFFIAILPDPSIQLEVTAFKEECGRLFSAGHALNAPPHVTLIAPFQWPEERMDEMKTALTDFSCQQRSFTIELDGFGNFPPRVIYVAVSPHESLKILERELGRHLQRKTGLKNKQRNTFRPHITIAHRDLQEGDFPEAWAHFSTKEYKRHFLAHEMVILRHINKKWEIQEHFVFGE